MTALSATPGPSEVVRDIGPVTRTDLVRYAGASGDFNPVHHDDEYARAHGFPSVFAMGMYPAGVLGAFASEQLGSAQLRALSIRFVAPTWPGDVMSLALTRTASDATEALVFVSVSGQPRVTGSVTFGARLPDEVMPVRQDDDPRLAEILSMRLSAVELPVEHGKVLEFARAVSAGGDASGLGVAPTFTTTVAHWDGGDATAVPLSLGLDLARVLHGEQKYRYHRPVSVGETLHGIRRVSAAYTRPARSGGLMTFVGVTTEFVDEAGLPVVDEEMVMVERPLPEG